ncbi:unnamed protein product [Rotaria sp. Silwood1]|nr:unnamed protein product [Rotaria sp. Silwood1]CAF4647943.1 unnamed protein product [Rotaria sp. Silwood1]
MSLSNTTVNLITSLNIAATSINRYVSIFIYIFGTIGNLLNILVLSQRTLRSNPSSIFFLFSSIAGLFVIISGLTGQMLSSYAADLTLTIDWICKLRSVVLYSSRTIVLWLIVSASVDRWLSSSITVRLRQMTTMNNVWKSIFVVLLYTCLLNAPIVYCFEANQTQPPRPCYASTYACRLITGLLYAFGTILLPLLLMIIFGLMTIKNVHQARIRVQIADNLDFNHVNMRTVSTRNGLSNLRKLDQYLIKMLLLQVILLFIFTFPHAIQRLYLTFALIPPPQSLRDVVETLIFNLFILLTYIASGMPFYIYTLTGGNIFRSTLFHVLKAIVNKILCQ